MSDLKHSFSPCPFCGNSDKDWMRVSVDEEREYRVCCAKCSASGPIKKFKAQAVRAWNGWKQRKESQP